MKTGEESNIICVMCGSDMTSYIVNSRVCYKCINKKCGYSFCDKVDMYNEVLLG